MWLVCFMTLDLESIFQKTSTLGSVSSTFPLTHKGHYTLKSSLFTVAYQRITGIVSIKCKDPSTEAWNLALTFSPWTSLRYIFSLKTHLKVRDKCTPGWQIK